MQKRFTLRPSRRHIVITDPDFEPECRLLVEPLTTAAIEAIASAYVADRQPGVFTVRHAISLEPDQTFAYELA